MRGIRGAKVGGLEEMRWEDGYFMVDLYMGCYLLPLRVEISFGLATLAFLQWF
jgi:hypothetical protein